jgi:cyclohexanecarboxyl-CoA dehydrogenase
MSMFTKEQEDFRKWVREFAEREFSEGALERGRLDHVDPEVIRKLAQADLLKLGTSAKYLSEPKDFVSIGIAFEEVCKVEYPAMIIMLVQIAIYETAQWMSDELRDRLLPASSSGEEFVCVANTEPDCGSDAAAIRSTAKREGEFYVLNGEKSSISGGMQADSMLVTAKTNPDAGVKGVTLFYVPLDSPGVSRSMFSDMGNLPSGRASIFLDNVRIPVAYRIGEEGDGFVKVMSTFDASRVLVGLVALAMAEASLEEATEYVKKRTAFGQPLSRFQGVSFRLAEHATMIEAARLMCYNALMLRDQTLPHTKEAAMAKWLAPKCAVEALHDLLLIFGHKGYSEDNAIEQRWRAAVGSQLGDGTAEIMKMIIAREMLGRGFGPSL